MKIEHASGLGASHCSQPILIPKDIPVAQAIGFHKTGVGTGKKIVKESMGIQGMYLIIENALPLHGIVIYPEGVSPAGGMSAYMDPFIILQKLGFVLCGSSLIGGVYGSHVSISPGEIAVPESLPVVIHK
jgi:hypothetical protein